MRALLDTNTLIHCEDSIFIRENLGHIFNWLDRFGYDKCVHPESKRNIEQHNDECIRISFLRKLASYQII